MPDAGAAAATIDWRGEVRDAAAAGFVAGALALALVGFRMVHVPGGIDLATRFDDVAAAVAVAFAGRLLIGIRPKAPRLALIGGGAAGILVLALEAAADLVPLARAILFESAVVNAMMALAAFVLAARAGWDLWLGEAAPDARAQEDLFAGWRAEAARFARYLGPALLVLALLLPFLPGMDRRVLDIAILVLTYVMLGWGLNIVVGLAGLLDLGYVAFYAVGAYSYALMAQYFGLGFWSCLPIAGLMAATAGVLLGFPVLRLRGDYLAIVTLGFGEMIRVILLNWYEFTNGPDGISGVPRPTIFGLPLTADGDGTTFYDVFGFEYSPLHRIWLLYYLILALALVTNAFTLRIRKLPVGRAWEALREDEIACRSLGINPRNTKLTAFGIGAMFGGFAGAFFATRQGFVSPESFTFIESAVILAIVVLGGMGSQIGVVFAAIVLIGLPEFFRELQQYRMLAFGAAMVLIMLWRPSGLLAVRRPTVALPPAPAAETAR